MSTRCVVRASATLATVIGAVVVVLGVLGTAVVLGAFAWDVLVNGATLVTLAPAGIERLAAVSGAFISAGLPIAVIGFAARWATDR